jgi:hypothetical protein
MMTRKDYVATAEIINSYASEIKLAVVEDLVNDFIEMFANDNEKFDSDRFWEECFKNLNVE